MLVEALEHLIRGLVDNPDDVKVVSRTTNRGEVLEVSVNSADLGRVIGKGGRNAKALRTLINALADGQKVRIDVLD